MGPLVPDVISIEFNYIVALFIGVAFGFVLEQAGFSSSRKLAGVFYGYDFTVLRVFFTAAVTAMIGVILMGYWGWLDLSLIYINPTYLQSMIAGGVIMGLGFILGGFCPGTSVCAAAIGKKDAFVFIAGLFIGVFIFGLLFPNFEGFYLAGSFGDLFVFESLGMSRGVFALVLIVVAIMAFIVTAKIQENVTGEKFAISKALKRTYSLIIIIAVALGVTFIFLPSRKEKLYAYAGNPANLAVQSFETVSMDKLAIMITDQKREYLFIDVRKPDQFSEFHLPNSVNIPFESFTSRVYVEILEKEAPKVILAANAEEAKKTSLLAKKMGYGHSLILNAGVTSFENEYLTYSTANPNKDKISEFRKNKAEEIQAMIQREKELSSSQPALIKPKRVAGGC